MKVLLAGQLEARELARWHDELQRACPEASWLDVESARENAQEVIAAVVANPRPGCLQGLPRLRLIQSLWAGVDRLLADPTLPDGVPIARMVDPALTAAMAETALWAVLALHRGFFAYARRQQRGEWRQHGQRRAGEVPVLVLGHGEMGRAVALRLAANGYRVAAWRHREAAQVQGPVRVSGGREALWSALPQAAIVINLLPLTADTRGLLDARFFAALPPQAAIVNLARGALVVDAELLAALDSGHLRHAVLDVFHEEPLPREHVYWSHPRVTVLPHVAALTDARSAAAVVAENLRAAVAGTALQHLVQREHGY